MGYFTPELFTFLRQLKRNNNRDWFNKNKERYIEDVQQPVLVTLTNRLIVAPSSGGFVKLARRAAPPGMRRR